MDRKIVDYCLAENVGHVKRLIEDGWQPLGGPAYILVEDRWGEGYEFRQAMVRYNDDTKGKEKEEVKKSIFSKSTQDT